MISASGKKNPASVVASRPHDLRSLWNYFFDSSGAEMNDPEPKIEVVEGKKAVNVVAEIPGIKEGDLDLKISQDGYLTISKGDGSFTRRQDAPKVWEYNGAVYVINTASLRRCPLGQFRRRRMSEMDAARSVDLDTELDWLVAEKMMESLR